MKLFSKISIQILYILTLNTHTIINKQTTDEYDSKLFMGELHMEYFHE